MFEIGFPELLLIAIVALLVLGPERLPEALRTFGLWMGRMRRSFNAVKNEIEKEIGMDEIRRQLHNEAVMEELKRIEREVRTTAQNAAGAPAATPSDAPQPPPTDASAVADEAGRRDTEHRDAGEPFGEPPAEPRLAQKDTRKDG